jgi:RNA polymerase sigma factor (sigma-70 family)
MQDLNFENTIEILTNKMYRLAKRLLISHEEAQDATQEVLLKLYKNNNNTWKNIEAYAVSSVKNYCLDVLKSKRSQNISLNNRVDFITNQCLIRKIDSENDYEIVAQIIANLPDQQKIIVQLRDIEQMEFDDIASIMKMNVTAVRMQLSRARKTIKGEFEKISNYGV